MPYLHVIFYIVSYTVLGPDFRIQLCFLVRLIKTEYKFFKIGFGAGFIV
jgi:hypothetical protein